MECSPTRKILYVTHRVPYPPDKGDRIRTYHTLRYLAQTHQVYLASLADEPVTGETHDVLDALCENVAIVPIANKWRKLRMAWSVLSGGIASLTAFRSSEVSRIIESWAKEIRFDLAIASASSVAPYLANKALRTVPALVDLVDVDSEKWLNYSAQSSFPRNWVYYREGTNLRVYEKQLSTWVQGVLLVSDSESELFHGIAPAARIFTVTNGVDLDYFQPMQRSTIEKKCAFIGALDYHPNVDAVCWFSTEVWPELRKKHPNSIFQIVGRRPVSAVLALGKLPGIEVVGQVPDVRPYLQEAAVVVAPLRIARGLQNKVLEAMAMAKPIVASPEALAGLQHHTVSPAIQAVTLEQWLSAIDHLFADSNRCQELGRQGRAYVETHYHWNRCLEPLQQLIEKLTEQNSSTNQASSTPPVAI